MYYYTIEDTKGTCYKLVKEGNAGSDSRDPCNWRLASGWFSTNFMLNAKQAEETIRYYLDNHSGFIRIREFKGETIGVDVLHKRVNLENKKTEVKRYFDSLSKEEKDYLLELVI